jgi:hypothetical protein
VVVVDDPGISSRGGATPVPILVQPPFTDVIAGLVVSEEMEVPPLNPGVVGQLGDAVPESVLEPVEPEFAGVLLHGDDTAFRVELLGAVVVDGEANGFETCPLTLLIPCSAARMPASTPSRSELVVSLNALWARSLTDDPIGVTG